MDSSSAEDAFISWDDLPTLAPLDPLTSAATPRRDHDWSMSLYDSPLEDVPHVSLDGELALPLEPPGKREPALTLPTSPIQSSQTIKQHSPPDSSLTNAAPKPALTVTPPPALPPRPMNLNAAGSPVASGMHRVFRVMHPVDERNTPSHTAACGNASPVPAAVLPTKPQLTPPHRNEPEAPRAHAGATMALGAVRTIAKTENSLKRTISKKRTLQAKAPTLSLKAKREREAAMFPKEALADLGGTTSAEVRKMDEDQRKLVLFKRKLRNRLSAKRSRANRQNVLAQMQKEVDELNSATADMIDRILALNREKEQLRRYTADRDRRIVILEEENERLKRCLGKDERHTSMPIERKLGA